METTSRAGAGGGAVRHPLFQAAEGAFDPPELAEGGRHMPPHRFVQPSACIVPRAEPSA